MRKGRAAVILAAAAVLVAASPAAAQSDEEIRLRLIEASIAAFPGKCPCPEYRLNNGRLCGTLSGWSQSGGTAPLCYPADVTDAMVAAWREAQGPGKATAPRGTCPR